MKYIDVIVKKTGAKGIILEAEFNDKDYKLFKEEKAQAETKELKAEVKTKAKK